MSEDLDVTKKSDVNKSAPKSPPRGKENRDNFSVSTLTVPVTSAKPQKNNFSISSLAVSSVKTEKGQYDYVLTPPALPPTPYSGFVSPFHPPPFLGFPYGSSAYGICASTHSRSYSISSLTSASVKSAPNSRSNSGDSLISTSSVAESRVDVPRSPRHTNIKKSP
ncbi:hypothetical protein ACJMK2_035087 [Sinanodonta woodiana]|uniref:Uncharacterized protein n=1 Tax=Sinanodonta woodiana TaxID=1069815 RepID=A0ABD3WV08_SINWO